MLCWIFKDAAFIDSSSVFQLDGGKKMRILSKEQQTVLPTSTLVLYYQLPKRHQARLPSDILWSKNKCNQERQQEHTMQMVNSCVPKQEEMHLLHDKQPGSLSADY